MKRKVTKKDKHIFVDDNYFYILLAIFFLNFLFMITCINLLDNIADRENFISCEIANKDDSDIYNYENIYKYCKENELEGYKLNVWWDGSSNRGGDITFTCGYKNPDDAVKYKVHPISKLKEVK